MIDISIIIPSLRPNILRTCLQRIYATTNKVDYEIILVSSLDLSEFQNYPKVGIVKEEDKAGSNRAIELGVQRATGKYLFMIADDHLLNTDCIYNLVHFMEQHDNELFLCGPRYHDIWEIHPENTIYGFYYAKTPCIKRENLSKIGGKFYDDYLHSYFGDPDLALRVLRNKGKVTICPTAWIEQRNVVEDVVSNDRNQNYFKSDSVKFLDKWKPIYGKRVSNPNRPEIVNRGWIEMFKDNELPQEQCSRIFHYMKTEQWHLIIEEINSKRVCSEFLLATLFGYCFVFSHFIAENIKESLFAYLFDKIKETKPVMDFVTVLWIIERGHKGNKKLIMPENVINSISNREKAKRLTLANNILQDINNDKINKEEFYQILHRALL